jgi:hypothetical protein
MAKINGEELRSILEELVDGKYNYTDPRVRDKKLSTAESAINALFVPYFTEAQLEEMLPKEMTINDPVFFPDPKENTAFRKGHNCCRTDCKQALLKGEGR